MFEMFSAWAIMNKSYAFFFCVHALVPFQGAELLECRRDVCLILLVCAKGFSE